MRSIALPLFAVLVAEVSLVCVCVHVSVVFINGLLFLHFSRLCVVMSWNLLLLGLWVSEMLFLLCENCLFNNCDTHSPEAFFIGFAKWPLAVFVFLLIYFLS